MGNPDLTQNLQSLGPYRITNLLGFNGVVATYKGFDQFTEIPSAIVAVHRSDVQRPEAWQEFEAEFKPMVSAGASRVCQAMNLGNEQEHYWASYQWMKGMHLGIRVRDMGLPKSSVAFQWMSELADALGTVHRRGVIHRIISPASIFISDLEQASLLHACWGRMILATSGGLLNPAHASILPFVSPEVAAGQPGDEAADVYSLGSNLYFLLTGMPVFWHDDPHELVNMLRTQKPDFSPLVPILPKQGVELIEELLATDAGERPLNLPALSDRLLAIAGVIDLSESQNQVPTGDGTERTRQSVEVGGFQEAAQAPAPAAHTGAPKFPSGYVQQPQTADAGYDQQYADQQQAGMDAGGHAPAIADILRERQMSHRQQQAAEGMPSAPAPAPMTVADDSGRKKKMLLVGGGVAVLLVLAIVGVAAVFLMGGGEADEEDEGPSPAEMRKKTQELETSRKYATTQERLRVLGQWNKAFFRTNGRWAAKPAELQTVGAKPEEIKDGWDRDFDVRNQFIMSAGADGTFDNADDIWVDADKGALGGFEPKAPAP